MKRTSLWELGDECRTCDGIHERDGKVSGKKWPKLLRVREAEIGRRVQNRVGGVERWPSETRTRAQHT